MSHLLGRFSDLEAFALDSIGALRTGLDFGGWGVGVHIILASEKPLR